MLMCSVIHTRGLEVFTDSLVWVTCSSTSVIPTVQREPALTPETRTNEQVTCARWVIFIFSFIYSPQKSYRFVSEYKFVCRLQQLLNPDPIIPNSESLDDNVSVGEFVPVWSLRNRCRNILYALLYTIMNIHYFVTYEKRATASMVIAFVGLQICLLVSLGEEGKFSCSRHMVDRCF